MNPLKPLMQDHGYQLGEDGRLTLGEPAEARKNFLPVSLRVLSSE